MDNQMGLGLVAQVMLFAAIRLSHLSYSRLASSRYDFGFLKQYRRAVEFYQGRGPVLPDDSHSRSTGHSSDIRVATVIGI